MDIDKILRNLYKVFLGVLGAIVYRVRGGLSPALPRPFDQVLFALAYGAIVYKASSRNIFWFLGILILTVAAAASGHGQYMDLGVWPKVVEAERLDFIVQFIMGDDNYHNYWRDALGLAVTGIAITLPCGIALMFLKNYLVGGLIALSGVLKAVAYMLAAVVGLGTVGGEYLTGLFLWGAVILLWSKVKD